MLVVWFLNKKKPIRHLVWPTIHNWPDRKFICATWLFPTVCLTNFQTSNFSQSLSDGLVLHGERCLLHLEVGSIFSSCVGRYSSTSVRASLIGLWCLISSIISIRIVYKHYNGLCVGCDHRLVFICTSKWTVPNYDDIKRVQERIFILKITR